MDIIYLLVSIAVVFILLVIAVFFWAIRNGQFDDLEGPAYRILKDDDGISGKDDRDK
ncbi:MAG: cbb3-type cytochrome oxidase assembly protein CcoS [Acidiferrobacterales bacterium]